ncbi:MAG TPA: glucose 1-dehydrogenase [Bacteroidales bacterium]|nr:glucose 1-dehydrogenase [Bacteroidales bacterium]
MKAIAIKPGKGEAHLLDINEPAIINSDEIKLKVLEVGICGTDREEVEGGRADAPAGENELIIGHEMFGRVVETGNSVKSAKKDDYGLFMVRRPCGNCYFCNNKRSDLCSTGDYTERGIKENHGFQAEYVVDKEEYFIPVPQGIIDIGVLTEPLSVVVKAVEEALLIQTSRFPGLDQDSWIKGKKALVAGLGPIGLLAAFVLKLRGAGIWGLDIVDESTARPSILKKIGGNYINGKFTKAGDLDFKYGGFDFIFEATGIAELEFQLMDALAINGIYVLTGIPSGKRPVCIMGADLMKNMVLRNQIMLGSVNAGRSHYIDAVDELVKIREHFGSLINELITEKVRFTNFSDALDRHSADEIKAVIEWNSK